MYRNFTALAAQHTRLTRRSIFALALMLCLLSFGVFLNQRAKANSKPNKRETTAQVCGVILRFQPATALSSGLVQISGTTYNIAPGIVISGQALIFYGQRLCLDLTLDSNNAIALGSAVAGPIVNVCGGVSTYKASTNSVPGELTINGTSYSIAPDFSLPNANLIANGANMCLAAILNNAGQIVYPSVIIPNVTPSLDLCGPLTTLQPATATAPGSLVIGGMTFTIAPGVVIPGLTPATNQCLSAFTDGFGRLIAPTSAGTNASGVTQICGTVSELRDNVLRIGNTGLPLGDNVFNATAPPFNSPGSSVCIKLVIANGRVARGSTIGADTDECPQFTVPTLVHGLGEFNQDLYTLPNRTVFTATSANANGAMSFSVTGGFPGYDSRNIAGFAATANNSVARAVSCSDSFWDFLFSIGSKGSVEGDMVKLFLASPGSNNDQVLAMLTVQNGGLVLNSVSPWLSLRTNGSTSPSPVGSFFPWRAPGPGGYLFTSPFVMVFSPDFRSPFNGCFQLGVELKRAGGNGMLSFVPLQTIVKRMDDTVEEGYNIDNGGMGLYPNTKPCDAVCPPCNDLPPPTSLSGYVYCELNNDGIKQAEEMGVAGATVTLTGTSIAGPVNVPATTDVNGFYSFNNLRPGNYTITETQPPSTLDGLDAIGSIGGTLGNDVISNIQLSTTSGTNYNFGEICNGSLAGFVFCDSNGDGIRQNSEGGLAGVMITLTGTSVMGIVNKTMQTDAAGNFVFENLAPGVYTITETQPDGFGDGIDTAGTLGGTVSNDVISNISVNNTQGTAYAFGEFCNRALTGFVYCDGNNDGMRQAGEAGLAGVTLTLTGTTAQGAVNRNTTTDGNGNYAFSNLQPGTYTITETQPIGYGDGVETAGTLGGTVGNDVISNIVLNNTDGTGYGFGERCGGNLSGFVYCDTNNDGVRQAGEGGVPGVSIGLAGTTAGGNVNRTTTTDQFGNYSFANLQPGTYAITETQPAGFADGKDAVGSIGGTLANDAVTGIVLANTDGFGYAFGEGCPGGLSGFVYCDFDDDGMREAGENGIAGVTINLTGTDANGPVSRLAITNSTGSYQFPNLLPGTYKITEIQPPGNVDGKDMVGTLGGIVTNDMFSNIFVNSNIGVEYNFGEACMPTKCDTICYVSPASWRLRTRFPNGAIIVAGQNFNNPISIQRNLQLIKNVLQSSGTGMLNLNREFVATQLSLAQAGGTGSPVVFNTFWSPLRCTGLNFAPVALSNGYVITPDTLLNDLVLQAQAAIRENRTIDMQALAEILALLNQKC